jgi:HlyD family secretion protein
MKSSLKIIAPIVILFLLLGGFFTYRYLKNKAVTYAGNIDATRVDLPARLPTTVAKILVHEGDVVEKDQILAELSCDDLKVSQKLIDSTYNRSAKLYRAGGITQEAFDSMSSKHDEISVKTSWCTVRTPIPGVVLTKYLEEGEWANPGTKIISVADLDDMYAYVYVPHDTMANLKVGQKVQGHIPEMNASYLGTIIKINDEAEFTPKNVQTRSERTRLVYGIKVSLPNEDRKLKPGMTIELEI